MAINVYDCGYGVYSYNTQTGQVSYATRKTQEEMAKYEKEQQGMQERFEEMLNNPVEPPEFLKGKTITVKDIQDNFELMQKKSNIIGRESFMNNVVSDIYNSMGLEPPQSHSDMTETDLALFQLAGMAQREHAGLLVPMTPLNGGGDPFLAVLAYAFPKEALTNAYSDESLQQKIESMNLPDHIDKDFLLSAVKSYGDTWKKMLDDNFDAQIKNCQRQDAATIYQTLVPAFRTDSNTMNRIDDLSKDLSNMLKEAADIATKYIREGYSGNIYEKIKEESSFSLEINGKSYKWNDIMYELATTGSYMPNQGYSRSTIGQCQETVSKYENQFVFIS